MSSYRESVILRLGIENLNETVRDVLSGFDWFFLEKKDRMLRVREKDRFDYYNPLEMEILIEPTHIGTRVEISANNSGYGPVQDEYIKGQVVRFLMALRKKEEETKEHKVMFVAEETDPSLSKELEKLSRLHDMGELTDEEFRKAKEKVLDG